jgi:dipeptidyl aminopeptidase/acylaminoacyl peptidase
VAGGAPCEFSWIASDSERLAFWLGGSRDKMPNVYAAASPITFVDEKDPPTFFFHGKADRIVPISSAQKMRQQLEAKGVPSNFHTVLDANHLGAFVNSDARKRAIEFLDSQLKQTKPEK